MWFLDIKDYVTAMKTVKQHNMANRELKLAIGDELQTLFHPIVNATKHAAEETRKKLELMKKTLTDIEGDLTAQREHVAKPPLGKSADTTFGIYMREDGQLAMGNKIVQVNRDRKTLTVDGTVYDFTPGLQAMIRLKHSRSNQWTTRDYQAYTV